MTDYVRRIRRLVGRELLMLPSVTAIIEDKNGVLLVDHRTADAWVLPGGALEPNESPEDAVVREVREETGLDVVPRGLLGVFAGPEFEVQYTNGDRVTYVMTVYRCEVAGGTLRPDGDETLVARFVDGHTCAGLRVARWVHVVLDGLERA